MPIRGRLHLLDRGPRFRGFHTLHAWAAISLWARGFSRLHWPLLATRPRQRPRRSPRPGMLACASCSMSCGLFGASLFPLEFIKRCFSSPRHRLYSELYEPASAALGLVLTSGPSSVCPQAQAGPWTIFSSLLRFSLTSRRPGEIALQPGSRPTESAQNTQCAFKPPEKKRASPGAGAGHLPSHQNSAPYSRAVPAHISKFPLRGGNPASGRVPRGS